ncbi:PilT/PilU family type 4a pilus ATPase [Candidatus Uhrbacteria bacterium]|nr:PilT/PilU family type 4a pilus ATPase [Candidatus Uhrbacteria bacterium]
MTNIESDKALGVINRLFDIAVERGASDVHLVVGKPPILRVSGQIEAIENSKELTGDVMEQLLFSMITEDERERFVRTKELDIAHQTPSGMRFRINLHWEKRRASMAARIIPQDIPTMDQLDLPPIAQGMTEYPHGLVIVTGPTGSGKSTTLAAMIEKINRSKADNIITLEDPIEFLFTSSRGIVRQRQLGQDFLSFAEGLKHILRQDPDVVMVGEMRDPETIATTLTIAETGHLVFATLHTYSAAQTIDRIIDAMPTTQQNQVRSQLALTLRAVVSQQLLPKVGGGRIAGREILVNNPAVANLIREGQIAQINNVIQTSANEGMITLSQDLTRLVALGLVEKSEANQFLRISEQIGDDDEVGQVAKRRGWLK